jgi:hypothetical protein
MGQDGEEECRVEKRDRGIETGGETPHEGLRPVGGVILHPTTSAFHSTPTNGVTYRLPCVRPPSTRQ